MTKYLKSFITVKVVQPRKQIVTVVKDQEITKSMRKTQYLRIAQVLFQVKLDASSGTTRTGGESREIQKQQLMPVGAWR